MSVFRLLTPLSGVILRENIITAPNLVAFILVCTGMWLDNAQISRRNQPTVQKGET